MNLNVEFGNRPLLILFMTPVILSALLGGLGPGLASTAIAATGIYFFYLPSFATLVKFKQHDLFQWCMLIVNGVSVSVLSEVLLRERARAKRSEERWTFALEGSGDGVWDWNALTNEVFYSRQWKAMLGYAEHEITNTLEEWERRVHPDDREQVQRNLTSHLEGLTDTYRSEHRMLCKDGSYKWILDRGKVISRTAEGKPLRVIGTHADISARKEAETRYHLLFDHSPDGIVVLDPETGGMLGFNEAASRQLGYSREEFARLNVSDIDASETSEETSNRMKKVMIDGRDDFETRHRTRGGEIRIVHVTAQFTRILGHPLYHCVWRDITERKQTEVNLRTSVQMWDNTFNAMHDAVSIMDEKGFIVRCNKAMLDLLGVSDQDISGRPCWEVVHSTNDRIENCPFEKMLRSHTRETLTAEMYGRWFSVTVDPIMNESGAITGGIHIIRDFTERKQAEEALMASEEQYRVLFEKSHDAIMVFAPHDNRFIKANAATARMFKAKDELAFTAYTPWDISPERQPDGQLSSVKALVMVETALREGAAYFEWTHKRLNGEVFPATVLLNPIEISGEKLVQSTVRDITEQARIMVALRESEEMVSLILNSASEGICGIDTDGNCMFCNAAGLRMLGYAQERDLIGRNMHSLIHHTTEH
ncbi:MAG TPA: PAS domain S-box protein, partial [Nitrospirota bacterium]|nr:PAS domain S-box protein [Nitrospirota bacterium]